MYTPTPMTTARMFTLHSPLGGGCKSCIETGIQSTLTGGPHWPCGALEVWCAHRMSPEEYQAVEANNWRLW